MGGTWDWKREEACNKVPSPPNVITKSTDLVYWSLLDKQLPLPFKFPFSSLPFKHEK
jgi:hypothetical protein